MKKFKAIGIIILFIILGAVGLVTYAFSLLNPVSSQNEASVRFVVPKGQAISIIGERLQEEGLIQHALAFRFAVTTSNLAEKIQAGSFDISPSMTTQEIAQHLTTGTEDTWITILEGWRVEEIAESLDTQDLDSFDSEEFIAIAQESEGMLFPDTYLIPREMSTQNIYSMLINTFERKVTQGLAEEISSSNRNFDDVLIMASLVEREARDFEQMQTVAGILWNRIDIGMALQVDATLQYSTGYNRIQQTWWAPPTSAQKQEDSLFNTYMHPGLPPRPISNPSLDAIKATLEPRETNDIFYIHANNGKMYSAQTLEEHNANINQYLR
jgi:UPF0755 protein